ncbi:MAG: DUF4397 domain-containing protein, partial [Microthrixaceae bacterium]
APSGATVYVTHGLPLPDSVTGPGTPVDVYVNGDRALDDFTFGQTAGPLTLPAGNYKVEIRTPDGITTLITKEVAVPGAGNFSLVASFVDAAGTPGINVFQNDVSRAWKGLGRVGLHHAAAAPAVDIAAGLSFLPKLPKLTLVKGAVNGNAATFTLPTFLSYGVDVRLAGTKTTVLSVPKATVSNKVLTNVYVVGSAAGGTLQPLVVTIPVG